MDNTLLKRGCTPGWDGKGSMELGQSKRSEPKRDYNTYHCRSKILSRPGVSTGTRLQQRQSKLNKTVACLGACSGLFRNTIQCEVL